MSLASAIITSAYREPDIIAKVSTPDATEIAEALALLNSLIPSVLGQEVGHELHDFTIGGTYDQSQFLSSWIPENARLVCHLSGARTFNAHPRPYEGQRLAAADTANNFSSSNLIINGNGRLIENAASVTLNTSGTNRQWMYRGDTGNWVKITSLASSDEMPFPTEFDDYFSLRLALRLVGRHSTSLPKEAQVALVRSETQLRARYRRPRAVQDMGTLGLLGGRHVCGPGFNPLR